MNDLSKIYQFIPWPMHPHDEGVEERISSLERFFEELISKHESFKNFSKIKRISLLELGAATGLVGAIFSKILKKLGYEPEITFSDIRGEDLKYVDDWVKRLGIRDLRYDVLELDSRMLPNKLRGKKFDVIMFWGSSLPHLDAYEFILTVSGIHEISHENTIVIFEQANKGWDILRSKSFKEMLVEGKISDEGKAIISIYNGYDLKRGIQFRSYYIIPGFKYIGKMKSRLWDIASIASVVWIFFRRIDILKTKDLRETNVVVGWGKRNIKNLWEELYEEWKKFGV